jgi:glycosyltransferase involved in cell wall biosynthesis
MSLDYLSSHSLHKSDWPWTNQQQDCISKTANISTYPRISIITPSYNQGIFIEETIRSVLLQGYPNLEYIIIDGGSTDNTVDIINKYEPSIYYWVSEPDNGQTHAINKGLAKATGDIIAYINSDDYYLPGTLLKVAEHFHQFPDTDLLHGVCRYVNQQGEKIGEQFGDIQTLEEILDLWDVWWKKRQFVQPEVFWTRRITEKIGFLKEELTFVMDYDYWCRIIQADGLVRKIDSELSCFRCTEHQKSNQNLKVAAELLHLIQPLLWSSSTIIPLQKRCLLQGNWLYEAVFLEQVKMSIQSNDRKQKRYAKLLKIILTNPQILLSSGFVNRIKSLLKNNVHWMG